MIKCEYVNYLSRVQAVLTNTFQISVLPGITNGWPQESPTYPDVYVDYIAGSSAWSSPVATYGAHTKTSECLLYVIKYGISRFSNSIDTSKAYFNYI